MNLRNLSRAVCVVAASVVTVCAAPVDFRPVTDFVKLPSHVTLDACSGVAVNSKGFVFLFHRGEHPIICLDRDGNYVRSWGDDLIDTAHGLRIDRDDHVWVTDIGNHQVFKFSENGELLMTLGKAGVAGDGIDEFNKPTDVAFGPEGEIYVTDGYGNSRVVKLTPNGGFVSSWGTAGKERGQFDTPHAISIDPQGRLVVGDRENDRIQIFDETGKLLHVWPGFAPFGIAHDPQGNLFVADGRAHKVLQIDGSGKVVASWGQEGVEAGQFQLPHMLAADSKGNLYIAEVAGKRMQKLERVE